MAYDAELALKGLGATQPGTYIDGVKQDDRAMAEKSGFIGTNNMGMKIGSKPSIGGAPPVAGSSLGGFANAGNPMGVQRAALPQPLSLPTQPQQQAANPMLMNNEDKAAYWKQSLQGGSFYNI